MATYTTETLTSTIRRWIVPAAEPWGATAEEIGKAWAGAELAYREHHGLDKDTPIAGNALAFHVRDDAVVIQFTTERPAE
ncbi:hypothetical protein [Streptomyces sp. NPDC059258]|uniref:hypothetical protein n=1 Tax=unclassified Streptomyces TaxID=2593676 RepID=UPI003692499C